jgi:CheY-specific phosphatase CheX
LEDSVAEVLEKMFFIRTLGEAPGAPREPAPHGAAPPKPEMVARLAFEGDLSGWLALRVTSSAARSIAADFLGEEEPALSEQQIAEVVCELANMICGSALSRVESGAAFRLAAPRIVSFEAPGGAPPGGTIHTVEIANGSLTVLVHMGRPACPVNKEHAF